MTFCIITHVLHSEKNHSFFAYSPYVNEMNIWLKYADKIMVVAPKEDFTLTAIHASYQHTNLDFITVQKFNTLSFLSVLKSVVSVPMNCWQIFKAMKKADHIHLRCPGNIGLLGCFIQILFPKKKKTAKYAGNWDPNAKQPLSYQLQKWILSNTFLTKNMEVLMYGRWPNQSANIKPFFTATYNEVEKTAVLPRTLLDDIQFLYVGTLSHGKQPLYAVQLVEKLNEKGHNVTLSLYGEGLEKEIVQKYIADKSLESFIAIKGNHTKDDIKKAYTESHFLLLPSKSEGWPKVVAEAMFWGCLPVATSVSCVPFMLDYGERGILLRENIEEDVMVIQNLCDNQELYNEKVTAAIHWSRKYTINVFESEIKKMMQP
ncbi:MAG: glycosyltransferase [Bacteroidota bacterium]